MVTEGDRRKGKIFLRLLAILKCSSRSSNQR